MPIVDISMFKGRSPEIKSLLVKAITEDMANILKISPDKIQVIIREVEKDNWAIDGKLFE